MRYYRVIYTIMDGVQSYFYCSALSTIGAIHIIARRHNIPESALTAEELLD